MLHLPGRPMVSSDEDSLGVSAWRFWGSISPNSRPYILNPGITWGFKGMMEVPRKDPVYRPGGPWEISSPEP